MKKLMLALAVAAVCSSSFAYNYKWKVGTTAVHDGTDSGLVAEGTVAYLFNAKDYSQGTLLAALFDTKSSIDTITANKELTSISANASSKFATYSAAGTDIGTTYDLSGTAMADVYFAIFSSDGKSVFVSATNPYELERSSSSATTQITFGSALVNASKNSLEYTAAKGFTSGGWYTAAPEPTSGLLLLLGVAGLALKRKRT